MSINLSISLGPWLVPATSTLAVWLWCWLMSKLDKQDDFGMFGFIRVIAALIGTLSGWCLFFALGYFGVIR